MITFRSLTDAGGHSIGEHVEHLRRSLDGFGRKLRDAVSVAVGETVSGTVQAALRAALADLAGLAPMIEEPRQTRYGGSYWGEPDEWGGPAYSSYRGPPPDEFDGDDEPERSGNRWTLAAFVGGRLLAVLLRRVPQEKQWVTAAGVGLLVILVVVAGVPGVGIFRSTMALTSLADILRGGVGAVSQFTS